MKNFLKLLSLLMFSGVLFVACGSNNNNGTAASQCAAGQSLAANGQCGMLSAACGGQIQTAAGCAPVSQGSGTCADPRYPYFISSVSDPLIGGQQVPACCNTPSAIPGQSLCVAQTNGYGTFGSGGIVGGCVPPHYPNQYGQCI